MSAYRPCTLAGINRYIVGCKYTALALKSASSLELIDTQWDVNRGAAKTNVLAVGELIDTQWDVNLIFDIEQYAQRMN